ncbi:hypothetical protein BJ138DRAFT_1107059 [Hygrophoropsis aurantiaca]|uniref:Uncharacterized protein n=1 Tax=Hygrophoropsis aurantiaca TaxID=72124 RepID=A0ACB7ZSW2_9AGAM|nr:hypothetical protein BJ138DRAFT_1107059 [Hygrophoropsis aurantiaca]
MNPLISRIPRFINCSNITESDPKNNAGQSWCWVVPKGASVPTGTFVLTGGPQASTPPRTPILHSNSRKNHTGLLGYPCVITILRSLPRFKYVHVSKGISRTLINEVEPPRVESLGPQRSPSGMPKDPGGLVEAFRGIAQMDTSSRALEERVRELKLEYGTTDSAAHERESLSGEKERELRKRAKVKRWRSYVCKCGSDTQGKPTMVYTPKSSFTGGKR